MIEPAYPRPYGSYTLLERLGAGGMSEVDLARRTVGDGSFVRFVVIKRIRTGNHVEEQYVRMFQDEARITAELSHENIAQVYDFGREGEEFYMAMEYVPGMDLRAVQIALAKRGKLLPVRIALTILCGVLRALQYAHTRVDQLGRPMNIVHRDVNPRNVMISVNGEVKLIDFGVAKASDRLEKTEGNAVKGKFAYMAPEQIDGSASVDGRADLFAVALVLHELLTGRSPFSGLTEVQILHRILSGKIPPLPDGIDHPDLPLLRRIHARGLAIRAADRYPSADAFRVDLEAALSPIGGLAPPLWIAELLRDAAGEGVADITRRLRSYRDGVGTGPRPVVAPPPPLESSGTLNVASIEAPPVVRTSWLAWAAAGVGFSGVVLIGLGLVGALAAWWSWSRESTAAEAPVADAAPAGAPAADPAPSAGPGAADPATGAAIPAAGSVPRSPANPGTTTGAAATASKQPSASAGTPAPTGTASIGAPPTGAPPAGAPSAGTAPAGAATGTPASTSPSAPASPPSRPPADPGTTSPAATAPGPTAATTTTPAATAAAPATVPATSGATAASTPAPRGEEGFLNLTSRPMKLDVYVDGKKVGTTPLRLHRLPVGSHEVAVRDPVSGRSQTRTVVISVDVATTLPPVLLE